MSRIQLALRVSDLDRAVAFYTRMFGTPPAKLRPDYANFVVDDPPLKLVLIHAERGGQLDHLGVELGTSAAVAAAADRLSEQGMSTRTEYGVECCYARQDKVWVSDPDGVPWEWYTVLEPSDRMSPTCC